MLWISDEPLPKNAVVPQQSTGRDSQAGFLAQEPGAPGLKELVTEPQSAGARTGTSSQGPSCMWKLVHALHYANS